MAQRWLLGRRDAGTVVLDRDDRLDVFALDGDFDRCALRVLERVADQVGEDLQHAIAVLMAVISYDTGRKTAYDHAKRTIKTA